MWWYTTRQIRTYGNTCESLSAGKSFIVRLHILPLLDDVANTHTIIVNVYLYLKACRCMNECFYEPHINWKTCFANWMWVGVRWAYVSTLIEHVDKKWKYRLTGTAHSTNADKRNRKRRWKFNQYQWLSVWVCLCVYVTWTYVLHW